jgi:hypothetical protein
MNSLDVANTVWALAMLDMPLTGSLHYRFLAAAEHVAPTTTSQAAEGCQAPLHQRWMPSIRLVGQWHVMWCH